MTQQVSIELQAPLNLLIDHLGYSIVDWIDREELEQLVIRNEAINIDIVRSIPIYVYHNLVEVFGNCLSLIFLLGEEIVFDIQLCDSQVYLDEFFAKVRASPTLVFNFRLDKKVYVGEKFPEVIQAANVYLYVFPEALYRLLSRSNFSHLETRLWRDPHPKVVILLPSTDVLINGEYLSVVGSTYVEEYCRDFTVGAGLSERAKDVFARCQDGVRWQQQYINQLTPLHFYVDRKVGGDEVYKLILTHLIHLLVFFLAERTITRNDQFVSIFITSQNTVEINHSTLRDASEDNLIAGGKNLLELFMWAYDPLWKFTDRLPFVQIGVVQFLSGSDSAHRFSLLLENSGNLLVDLKWHWKAFIEGKVDEYVDQVRNLEDYVSTTIHSFTEQISALVKNLNDTMLAAVGALIGSFVAALFTDKFNPAIFRIGLGLYAFYVFLFPLIYSMRNQWEQFVAVKTDFQIRKKRFEERLYKDRVDNIVGEQVSDSIKRVKSWFFTTIITYLIVIFMAIAAAVILPAVIQRTSLADQTIQSPIQTQTLNPTITPEINTPYP